MGANGVSQVPDSRGNGPSRESVIGSIGTFLYSLEKFAEVNATMIYNYGTSILSADQLTNMNIIRMTKIASNAKFLGQGASLLGGIIDFRTAFNFAQNGQYFSALRSGVGAGLGLGGVTTGGVGLTTNFLYFGLNLYLDKYYGPRLRSDYKFRDREFKKRTEGFKMDPGKINP